ncbi:hypothetical protein V500_00347 [Pseudogymnoascus sp. VKM F-4518 (FW-2643)]|nr:hypothetical protein V500_00347 [Pseudogymnoascus sp. VKM F-4518 (FW-2643)]
MGSNQDSFQHEVEGNGHYPAMEMRGSKAKVFTEWFREYTAAGGNRISSDSDVIQAVDSDELDAKFVEQRIKESTPNVPIVKGFCAKCQSLFDHWPTIGDSSTKVDDSKPSPDGGWHHTVARQHTVARPCSTFELEGSTRSGCRFCTFLLQSLKDSNLLGTFRKIEARLCHLDENALSSLSIQNWEGNPIQLLWLNLPGKICTGGNSDIASSVKFESRFLPESADCYDDLPDVFNIASNWLSNCTESHDLCKSSGDGTLPTRLISVTGESPRLVLTSECLIRPRYATLSHSWGSYNVIKLTSEDLDTYMEALPLERFPKTFKEAIEITQRLGLDYLWIDSLCIIQDNVDDWQKESALMSSVFGGSTITIAASSARDGSQGCFMKQPYCSGGLRARITDGELRRVQDFRSGEVYGRSTFKTHLGTRAWALQEKMLASRTIHFGDRGAFWEFRTKIASEYLPDGFPGPLVRPLVSRKWKFQHLWPVIVRLYSAANLTFGKDKLPALSGIAKLGYNETGDQYLAGLWKDKLEEQLCWGRGHWESESTMMRPRPPWRAPTWSWASIDGEVMWRPRRKGIVDTPHVKVLHANTTKYSYDPFGQVTSGVIRLACSSLAAGYLVHSSESNNPEPKEEAFIVPYAGNRELNFSVQIDCQDDRNNAPGKPSYLLPLFSGKTVHYIKRERESKDGIREVMIEGIVLQATGATKGEFSRIGYFKFYKSRSSYDDNEEETYEQFLKVLKGYGKTTAKAVCTEVISNRKHVDKRYVITLV